MGAQERRPISRYRLRLHLGRVGACLVTTLALAASACGDDDGGEGATGTEEQQESSTERTRSLSTEEPASTATSDVTTTTAPETAGALTPRSAPPGVQEQFEYFDIGNGPCAEFADEPGPAAVANIGTFRVLMDAIVCLPGFDPDALTAVTIVAADGAVTELSAPQPPDEEGGPATVYEGVPYLLMELELYASTGEYQVTARQGSAVATTSFTVEQPSIPLNRVRQPTTGSRGDSFTVQFAGLPAGERATVDVYALDAAYTYVATISTAAADQQGRVELVLSTSSADPPGRYCFVVRTPEKPRCPYGSEIELG